MVKLSARESRTYGPHPVRDRWEYINAGIYVFSTIFLIGGFAAQLSPDAKSGLVVLLIGIALIAAVNAHDLVAHMAGVDYCLSLVESDPQLALVEFAAPLVNFFGSILTFIAIIFLLIQKEKGYSYKLEKHALNMLIAGPVLWVIGSIHNLCQTYERADGRAQILQKAVQIPFLMGSLLFLVGGVSNRHEVLHQEYFKLVGESWVWLCISGSLLFFVGGVLNVVKVFKMQEVDGVRLEKLRDGGQERLGREREGKVPLILEEDSSSRSRRDKDVLVGGSQP